jgi:hypothetical protein
MLFWAAAPIWAASVTMSIGGNCGPFGPVTVQASPLATISGFCNQTVSALELPSSVSAVTNQLDSASVDALANFTPTLIITGGIGQGFINVDYISHIMTAGTAFFAHVSFVAGTLSFQGLLTVSSNPVNLSQDAFTGFLPFTFGQPLVLAPMHVELYSSCIEICSPFTVSESIGAFDVRDANMGLVDAHVEVVPEPASLFLMALGLSLVVFSCRNISTVATG